MKNLNLISKLVAQLDEWGVSRFCLCGGSRNASLNHALAHVPGAQPFAFFEERSAGFFAVGLAKQASGRPAAVVTTSGTAVAELLPACIEAHYAGLPVCFITADRPRRLRGTGAPQAIEQRHIFGNYVEASYDLAAEDFKGDAFPELPWSLRGPLHVNICLEDDLFAGDLQISLGASHDGVRRVSGEVGYALAPLQDFLRTVRRPLCIVGALRPEEREPTAAFLRHLGAPVYAESLSGLREREALAPLLLKSSERVLKVLGADQFDAVVRIGSVPHLRFWRDLDERLQKIKVFHVSRLGFTGLSRGELLRGPLESVLKNFDGFPTFEPPANLRALDDRFQSSKLELFAQERASEPALLHRFSRRLAPEARLFLGNSLPIREWDLAAHRRPEVRELEANRGANGIDGQISTFLGWASRDPAREAWAVLGDLTALYDLAGLSVLAQIPFESLRLLVINNGGGMIFSRLAPIVAGMREEDRARFIEMRHELNFEPVANLWKMTYESWDRDIPPHLPGAPAVLVELRPDAEATARFWSAFEKIFDDLA